MTTRRRTLAFFTTLALLPCSIASAQESPGPSELTSELERIRARALALRVPLVVFVVPQEEAAQDLRAGLLRDLFLSGPRDALALLGMVELACATVDALRVVFPEISDAEPFVYFVAPRRRAHPQAFDIRASLESLRTRPRYERLDEMAAAVMRALAQLDSALVDRQAVERAYQRFEERYLEHAIPGSRWGDEAFCGMCGMGAAAHQTIRFLDFLTRRGEPRGRGE